MRKLFVSALLVVTLLAIFASGIALAGGNKPEKVDVCFPIGRPEDNKWQQVNVSIKAWENHFSEIEDAFKVTEEKPCPPESDEEPPDPGLFDYVLYLPRVIYNIPFSPRCYPWCTP